MIRSEPQIISVLGTPRGPVCSRRWLVQGDVAELAEGVVAASGQFACHG